MAQFILRVGLLVLTSGVVLGDFSVPYSQAPAPAPALSGGASPIPYVQQYSAPFAQPPSFGVQTGYDGYIVSAPEQHLIENQGEDGDEEEEAIGIMDFFKELGEELGLKGNKETEEASTEGETGLKIPASILLFPLLKKITWPLSLLLKFGLWLFSPLSYALLGGALTVGACVFTPFCTLSVLGLGLKRENVRSFMTQDRLASISNFVNEAIRKFQELQKKTSGKGRNMDRLIFNVLRDNLYAAPSFSDNSVDTSTRKNEPDRKEDWL